MRLPLAANSGVAKDEGAVETEHPKTGNPSERAEGSPGDPCCGPARGRRCSCPSRRHPGATCCTWRPLGSPRTPGPPTRRTARHSARQRRPVSLRLGRLQRRELKTRETAPHVGWRCSLCLLHCNSLISHAYYITASEIDAVTVGSCLRMLPHAPGPRPPRCDRLTLIMGCDTMRRLYGARLMPSTFVA